jgi:hypothetical protein
MAPRYRDDLAATKRAIDLRDGRVIQPDLERKFAKAMNAKTIMLPSSQVAMLSHPAEVAKLIIEAAKTAPVNQ